MRVIYMGTPEFAVKPLAAIAEEHEVVAVITQPDRPKGRGNKVAFSEVKEEALKHGFVVLQPERIRSKAFAEKLKKLSPDIFVVAAYGQILPRFVLDIPKYGAINIHGSLLPKYRGAAPIQWSIINGETVTGVTIIQMDNGIDTGDMLLKAETTVMPEDTAGTLYGKLSDLGAAAVLEVLRRIEDGSVKREKQNEELSSYAPMLDKDTGNVNWEMDAVKIVNLVRGVNPSPGAYTYADGVMLKIWGATAVDIGADISEKPGEVIAVDAKKGIIVAAGSGAVLITELQKTGGKRMKAADFLRGNSLLKGCVFNVRI